MKNFLKKISVCLLSGILMFSSVPGTVDAHSGRTDANGGHRDNQNKSGLGSYHYHCGGYPAHLHEGGVCPYTSGAVSTAASSDTSSSSQSNTSDSGSVLSTSGKGISLSSGEDVDFSKDLVKIVQDVLNQKGYDCGKADGVVGTKTQEALKEFLEDNQDNDSTDYLIISMIAEGLEIE